ncbi:Two-component system sensor histidine kinase, partial [hydrothermal vent metagenome]
HRDNPSFVEDAFATVDNSVQKMNRLLAQLRKGRMASQSQKSVDLGRMLEEVVAAHAGQSPVPCLSLCHESLAVIADSDRLTAVIGHLVQNAQDATDDEGGIQVRLWREGETAVMEIEDDGCGMDASFIRERLFRPFDTTKGNAGMGIGVYESREFIHALGGRLDVRSELGIGTTFRIALELAMAPLIDDVREMN